MKKHTQRMISDIESEVKYTRSMIGTDELDPGGDGGYGQGATCGVRAA